MDDNVYMFPDEIADQLLSKQQREALLIMNKSFKRTWVSATEFFLSHGIGRGAGGAGVILTSLVRLRLLDIKRTPNGRHGPNRYRATRTQ